MKPRRAGSPRAGAVVVVALLGLLAGVAPAQIPPGGPTAASQFRRMPAAEQRRIEANYRRFKSLTPGERQELRQRYQQFQRMSLDDQARVWEAYERLKSLPEPERRQLIQALQRR